MLYRATNKSGNKLWIIADNEPEALDIAVAARFIRIKSNCRLETHDDKGRSFYDFFKAHGNNMTAVDNKKGTGAVAYKSAKDKGTWLVHCPTGFDY
jgi:hypothetical protein